LPPHGSTHSVTVALLTAVACAALIANAYAAGGSAANDTPLPQAAPVAAAPPCTPSGPYEPICGLQAPEDLERLPGGGRLLVSQMRGPTHLPDNNIAELDLATRAIRVLPVVPATRVAWADAGCTEPDPKHDVHGFDLSSDAEDNLQLLVVNHGSRESIEIFQVAGDAGDRTLQWRGCVVTPADVRLNDVAARPQGGFIATVMGEAKHFSSPEGFKFLVSGENTGYLLEWTPDGGFRKLPGSDAAFAANLKAVVDHLKTTRHLPLDRDDVAGLEYVYRNFHRFGPAIHYTSSINGQPRMSSYATNMASTDAAGVVRTYLANDEMFQRVKALERTNLIVPVVGDFAGPKALRAIGAYARRHRAIVSAFYISNVEEYLPGQAGRSFCGNVASLPLTVDSMFIRAVRGDTLNAAVEGFVNQLAPMIDETRRCGGRISQG
jgi:hypothetical protein